MQRVLETLSLFALLSVVALRPLVSESYDSGGSLFSRGLESVTDPSPVRTLVFDAVILLATLGWLFARAIGRTSPYRRTGLEWGGGLLLVASALSCVYAGNQRLAINGSVDWLCYPLLTIALSQLMTKSWHRRLLLGVVLASALVQAAQCFEQYFIGFDETWRHYLSIKVDLWGGQGVSLDSPKVEAFERRLLAHEAAGFLPHSNVAGSYLVLCSLAAMALATVAWRRAVGGMGQLRGLWTTFTAGLIVCAATLTNSLGAWISGAVGLVVLCAGYRYRCWIERHRMRTVMIGWSVATVGLVAVVGHGLYHNSLPGWSLTFRWQYWRASAAMIGEHPITGVGRENFGRHYVQFKPIENPEEVANPHNLLVQAAADWGLPGLVGLVVMFVGVSLRFALPPPGRSPPGMSSEPPSALTIAAWGAAFVLMLMLVRPMLLGSDEPNFLFYSTVTVTLAWMVGFASFYLGLGHGGSKDERCESLMIAGVGAGLLTVLLHDMINFALFVPGVATTFFALLAYRFGGTAEPPLSTAPSRVSRWFPVAFVLFAVGGVVYGAVLPVGTAAEHLASARALERQLVPAPLNRQVTYRHFELAAAADPQDPTPHAQMARWLVEASAVPEFRDNALALALDAVGLAIRRDPFSVQLRRLKMQIGQRVAAKSGGADDFGSAITAAREALSLYPQDPHGLVALGDCQLDAGRAMKGRSFLEEAISSYEAALSLDGARLWWETLRRFSGPEMKIIEVKMGEARSLLAGLSP